MDDDDFFEPNEDDFLEAERALEERDYAEAMGVDPEMLHDMEGMFLPCHAPPHGPNGHFSAKTSQVDPIQGDSRPFFRLHDTLSTRPSRSPEV